MKKILVLPVCGLLLMSSCTTAGDGAVNGAMFGSIIGSAIGGIAGGHRGHDIGTLIGMAGGAVAGAAVGSANEQSERKKYEEYRAARRQRPVHGEPRTDDVYQADETASGDDRLYGLDEHFNITSKTGKRDSIALTDFMALEIRNAHFIDANHNGGLSRGEEARMAFEIYNMGSKPVRRVLPSVTEITGNKHVYISENVMVESIMPGKGIRYTATIRGGSRLRNGEAVIRISVFQDNREVVSQSQEFRLVTSKH